MKAPPKSHSRPRIARQPTGLGTNAIALIATSAVAIAAGAKIGEDVFNHETAPFDEPIRAWVLNHQAGTVRKAFLVITYLGSPSVVIPLTAAVAGVLSRKRGLPIAGAVVLAPAVATALFSAFKYIYARKRPDGATRLNQRTYSFPSGHATASAAILSTLGYVLWREELISGRDAILMGSVGPLAIGASRVYLDVHWSTDVLGGWSLGTLVAAMSAAVYERVRRNTRERGVPV